MPGVRARPVARLLPVSRQGARAHGDAAADAPQPGVRGAPDGAAARAIAAGRLAEEAAALRGGAAPSGASRRRRRGRRRALTACCHRSSCSHLVDRLLPRSGRWTTSWSTWSDDLRSRPRRLVRRRHDGGDRARGEQDEDEQRADRAAQPPLAPLRAAGLGAAPPAAGRTSRARWAGRRRRAEACAAPRGAGRGGRAGDARLLGRRRHARVASVGDATARVISVGPTPRAPSVSASRKASASG